MKVLFVASEATPFVKTGGLADVSGSLPQVLAAQGVDVRVILPKYGSIPEHYRREMRQVCYTQIPVAWRSKYAGIDMLTMGGVVYYFVDNEEYFARDGLYGYEDDAQRFSFFCRAVLNLLPLLEFWPDVIHANDWHAALVPVFLRLEHMGDERYERIRTVFTIHNLKYQGIFGREVMHDVLGLDEKYIDNGDFEYYGAINFMKAGIVYADEITTVSASYAQEIQYEYFGEGLDGLLRARADHLHGIVNGIDQAVYNPATDKALHVKYDAETAPDKLENKAALQRELGLTENRRMPLVAMVTRLVEAKGIDLLVRILPELLTHEDFQFVVLGTGDYLYEEWFCKLAWRFPQRVSAQIYFNNELAQRIYAGSDIFLMPSKYEPCGIGQLIALRYGSVPIVRATGGLRDTVQPYDKVRGTGNGFTFENFNAHELMYAMKRAFGIYGDIGAWKGIVKNAMQSDYSWGGSAAAYRALYEKLAQ